MARRSTLVFVGSRLPFLLGGNGVTRHDAVVSVRAGFIGNELPASWRSGNGWTLRESAAGLFSHAFVARRKGP